MNEYVFVFTPDSDSHRNRCGNCVQRETLNTPRVQSAMGQQD